MVTMAMTLVILWPLPMISTLISSTVCQHLLVGLAPNCEMFWLMCGLSRYLTMYPNDSGCFSCSATMRMVFREIGWITVEFVTEIHVSHRMNCDYFGCMLTFHPANLVTSVSHLWSVMWTRPVCFFAGATLTHTSLRWRTERTAGRLCCWRLMTSFGRLLTG